MERRNCCNLSGGVKCVIHHGRDVREEQHHTYMWREQAIIGWSWHVSSIVACCLSAKLCAHAARDFRSQQNNALCSARFLLAGPGPICWMANFLESEQTVVGCVIMVQLICSTTLRCERRTSLADRRLVTHALAGASGLNLGPVHVIQIVNRFLLRWLKPNFEYLLQRFLRESVTFIRMY